MARIKYRRDGWFSVGVDVCSNKKQNKKMEINTRTTVLEMRLQQTLGLI